MANTLGRHDELSLLAEIVDFSCGIRQIPNLWIGYHIFSEGSLNICGMVEAAEEAVIFDDPLGAVAQEVTLAALDVALGKVELTNQLESAPFGHARAIRTTTTPEFTDATVQANKELPTTKKTEAGRISH
jgi:hypothetical protein